MTWLKLGDSKAEGLPSIQLTLNVAIDFRTHPLPITSIAISGLFLASSGGRFGSPRRIAVEPARVSLIVSWLIGSGPQVRWRAKGCDRFLRGAETTVVGSVGGREIIGMRRFAGKE
jgi:hypothetical protein